MEPLAELEAKLSDPKRAVRYRAIYRLAELDDPQATHLLIRALEDEDREIRSIVAKMLANRHDDGIVDKLSETLATDRYALVRRAAAEALGMQGSEDTIPGLLDALYDRSKMVRRAAVQSLRMVGDERIVPGLVGVLLGDADSYVRWEAAKTLGDLISEEAIPALIEALLADENSYVRYAAAEALGLMDDDSVIEPLRTAVLHDENSYVRFAAARALRDFLDMTPTDTDMVQTFLRVLNDSNPHVWHMAAEALWSGGPDTFQAVLDALTSPDMSLRRVALKGVLWLTAEFDDEAILDYIEPDIPGTWGWWN